jgi:hypothetical protein
MNLIKIRLEYIGSFGNQEPLDGFAVLTIVHLYIKAVKLKKNDCLPSYLSLANMHAINMQQLNLLLFRQLKKLLSTKDFFGHNEECKDVIVSGPEQSFSPQYNTAQRRLFSTVHLLGSLTILFLARL